MKILDVSQSQGIYTRDSKSTEDCRRLNQAAGFKNPEIEVTISKKGWDAWREAVVNERTGNFGMMTGWEDPRNLPKAKTNEVFFEHLMGLGKAMQEVDPATSSDGVDSFMKSLMEAYEIVYNNIMEQHAGGNREVTYDLTGDRSLSLQEDLDGLNEAYDYWVGFVDAYVLTEQRMKDWRPTGMHLIGRRAERQESEDEKKYMTEEYHQYRRSVVAMMKQGREDFLALFQKLDGKKGLAKDIIVGLMNRSNGFWEKTRELWPDVN